jgi:hypothetical protein
MYMDSTKSLNSNVDEDPIDSDDDTDSGSTKSRTDPSENKPVPPVITADQIVASHLNTHPDELAKRTAQLCHAALILRTVCRDLRHIIFCTLADENIKNPLATECIADTIRRLTQNKTIDLTSDTQKWIIPFLSMFSSGSNGSNVYAGAATVVDKVLNDNALKIHPNYKYYTDALKYICANVFIGDELKNTFANHLDRPPRGVYVQCNVAALRDFVKLNTANIYNTINPSFELLAGVVDTQLANAVLQYYVPQGEKCFECEQTVAVTVYAIVAYTELGMFSDIDKLQNTIDPSKRSQAFDHSAHTKNIVSKLTEQFNAIKLSLKTDYTTLAIAISAIELASQCADSTAEKPDIYANIKAARDWMEKWNTFKDTMCQNFLKLRPTRGFYLADLRIHVARVVNYQIVEPKTQLHFYNLKCICANIATLQEMKKITPTEIGVTAAKQELIQSFTDLFDTSINELITNGTTIIADAAAPSKPKGWFGFGGTGGDSKNDDEHTENRTRRASDPLPREDRRTRRRGVPYYY